MRIKWSPAGRASARRYMADQDAMRAIGAAVAALAADPLPAEGFHTGEYHRPRVGATGWCTWLKATSSLSAGSTA